MNSIRYAAATALLALTACSGGGSDTTTPRTSSQTYSAELSAIELVRTSDQQPLPVDGLPSTGAPITVVE